MSWQVPVILAQSASRTFYEIARLRMLDQWWHWLVFVVLTLLFVSFVIRVYQRDGRELPTATKWSLMLLRMAALSGLLLFFLQIEKRSEQKLVKHSRAILLVDTSQSMGLSDPDPTGQPSASRLEQVAAAMEGPLLEELQADHDVIVYAFDQSDSPSQVTVLPTTKVDTDPDDTRSRAERDEVAQRRVKWLLTLSAVAFSLALLAGLSHLVLGRLVRNAEGESWRDLVLVVSLIVAGVLCAISNLRYPEIGWRQVFGDAPQVAAAQTERATESPDEAVKVDWKSVLTPRGSETRLGAALEYVIDKERGGPVAGIGVFTDGNSNAGVDYREAVALAREAEIPVHLVGVGSNVRPTNVRLMDVAAPRRVYPGDQFSIRGFYQSFGLSGRNAKIELYATSRNDSQSTKSLLEEQLVTLRPDGEVATVEFMVTPDVLGEKNYLMRVVAGEDLDPRDNDRSARVQVVDRKNRVLLLAGGPTREYRFLRDLCFRDQEATLDVLLQSSPAGAAQEADTILTNFPSVPAELFEYDCIVAFDPDWESLDVSQIELLDRWVAEKAGGLVLVAGPVFLPEWTTLRRDHRGTKTLKGLFPVTFFGRAAMRLARGQDADVASPLEFSEEGRQARFLWLADSLVASERIWTGFEGVYAPFPIKGLKPGAILYASCAGEGTAVSAKRVMMAEQFYGAGRVFYLGSGEMWRLRPLSPAYFEQFYTQLIRHVSQGRLLRDSSRGVLMLGKERCVLGEVVTVRAVLTDAQFRPLEDASVRAELVSPDGLLRPLVLPLVKSSPRPGSYLGQFTANQEGDFRVELTVPDSDSLELLAKSEPRCLSWKSKIRCGMNALMNEIAEGTGGNYYVGLEHLDAKNATTDAAAIPPLTSAMVPQDQETYLPGTPDRKFQERLMGWLMALICGVLSAEWFVRRLNRLA